MMRCLFHDLENSLTGDLIGAMALIVILVGCTFIGWGFS
jgi:hypothetical protein